MFMLVSDFVSPRSTLARQLRNLRMVLWSSWPVYLVAGGALLVVGAGSIWYFYPRRRRCKTAYPGMAAGTEMRERYPGIHNIGNSCYLNSILQALSAVHIIMNIEPVSPFASALLQMLVRLNTPHKGTLDASSLVRAMGGTLSGEQQDAHELLQAMLSVLSRNRNIQPKPSKSTQNVFPPSEENNASNNSMPWEGVQITCVKCAACGRVSDAGTRGTAFSMLTLPSSESLDISFQLAMSPDHLGDYRCGGCDKRGSCFKLTTIVRWPTLLIINVQRIAVASGAVRKDGNWMYYPSRMEAWRQDRPILGEMSMARQPEYELAAVVEHHGGINYGHYTTFRRILTNGRYRWLHCSDTAISNVSLEQVLQAQAYLLFYHSVAQ